MSNAINSSLVSADSNGSSKYQLNSKEQEQLRQLLDSNNLMRHIIVIRSESGYGFTLSRCIIYSNEEKVIILSC